MRKFRRIALAALVAVSLTACREDEPEIDLPQPEERDLGTRSLELMAPDTLAFNVTEAQVLRFRTTPWDLPQLDNAVVGVVDGNCLDYGYAAAGKLEMLADSSWTVALNFDGGARRGDVIRLSLEHKDTVLYSRPCVLEVSSPTRFIEKTGTDTLTFNEGEYPVLGLYTNPWNMLVADSVKIGVYTEKYRPYQYGSVVSRRLEKDNTWSVTLRLEYGMKDGDRIRLGVQDSTVTYFTKPIILDQIPASEVAAFIMKRLSGPISAYENGGAAAIHIRTNPWNMFWKSHVRLAVTDTLGNASQALNIQELEFQPDSSWIVRTTLSRGTATSVRLGAEMGGDTLCLSEKVDVRKVSIGLSSVKVNGTTIKKSGSDYVGLFPVMTDFSEMKLAVTSMADSVLADGVKLEGTTVVDMSRPVTLRAHLFDISHDFVLDVHNTGLPVVHITTPATITSKKVWMQGCTIRIELPDGTVDLVDTLEMRGRGNNTWSFNKKPYALRMDGRTKVLGMPKHKRWILLANYKDRTLMRNDATFWLSKQTGLNYTIHGKYVELVMNGKHVGNYYLCEQGKIDRNRIDISEPNPYDPQNSGYLVEIDTYYDNDRDELSRSGEDVTYFGFKSAKFNLPYQFKEPDRTEMTQESFDYFRNFITEMETVLKNADKVKNHEYEKYIDVDQAIDYMLVNELAGNHDFYNTYPVAGPHSTYLYFDAAGDHRLCYGPGWDFDYHTYMPSRSSGWIGLTAHRGQSSGNGGWNYVQNEDYYFYAMLKDPKFMDRVIERWDMQKNRFKELPAYIDSMADALRDSETANYKVWGAINNMNGDENEDKDLSFQAAVDKMKKGFNARWTWIDTNIRKIKL